MSTVSADSLASQTYAMNALYASATDELNDMLSYLERTALSNETAQLTRVRDAFWSIMRRYSDASGVIGRDLYSKMRAEAGAHGYYDAVTAKPVDIRFADSVTFGNSEFVKSGDYQKYQDRLQAEMMYAIFGTMRKTITGNAVRENRRMGYKRKDGVTFARVPQGVHTCAFCIMLAGRGFVYASKESAGEFDKYHDDCDCRIVAAWGEDSDVEDYDSTEFENMYKTARKNANSGKTSVILSNMRSMYGLS